MWKGDYHAVHLGSVKPLEMSQCFLLRMGRPDNQPLEKPNTERLRPFSIQVFIYVYITKRKVTVSSDVLQS